MFFSMYFNSMIESLFFFRGEGRVKLTFNRIINVLRIYVWIVKSGVNLPKKNGVGSLV